MKVVYIAIFFFALIEKRQKKAFQKLLEMLSYALTFHNLIKKIFDDEIYSMKFHKRKKI